MQTEAPYTPSRWEILERKTWESADEQTKKFLAKAFESYVQAYGRPFVIRYGGEDLRVLWGKEIKVDRLKQEIRSPTGSSYDCPLCQPYEEWNVYEPGNRRFLCKVVDPRYPNEMENGGTWMKCPCLRDRPSRHRS